MEATKTLVDTAVDQLIYMILEQKLQPGDKLPNEYVLAEHLGIGRSTLREAIRRLVSRNVLQVRQGSGTYISEKHGVPEDPLGITFMGKKNDPKVALDLLDIRLMIEPEICAGLAIGATPSQLEGMRQHCNEVATIIQEGGDYSQADGAMHGYFAECSGNRVLKNLIPIITTSVHQSIFSTNDEHRQQSNVQHFKILESIVNKDAQSARYHMITHLNTSRESILAVMKQGKKTK